MLFKNKLKQMFFITSSFFMPLAYAEKKELDSTDMGFLATEWSNIDYVLYGALVTAIVLFVMSVMKKPDEIF